MKALLLTVSGWLLVLVANGQYFDKMYFLNWSVNQPLSNTDFVGNASTRGGRLGYQEMINEKFSGGLDISWATYDDYIERQTYFSNNGAITTDYFKYVESYAATVTFNYFFFTEKKLMPYVGIGLGANYNSYKLYYNVFSSSEGGWGFLSRPQAGAWLRLGKRTPWGLHASTHFDFSTANNEDLGYQNFSNIGFQLGLVYLDW